LGFGGGREGQEKTEGKPLDGAAEARRHGLTTDIHRSNVPKLRLEILIPWGKWPNCSLISPRLDSIEEDLAAAPTGNKLPRFPQNRHPVGSQRITCIAHDALARVL